MGRATGMIRFAYSDPPHNSVTVRCGACGLNETFDKIKVQVQFEFHCYNPDDPDECCDYTWYVKHVKSDTIIDSGSCCNCDEPYACPSEKNYELGEEYLGTLEANITMTSGTNDKELSVRLSINNFYT